MNKLSFVSLACMLALGCVVTDDDDDATTTTTAGTNPTTSASDSGNDDNSTTPATTTTNGDATSTTDGPSDSSGNNDSTAGSDSGSDTGAGAGTCGWGKTGQKMISEGYVCGGMGESPMPEMFPIDCPAEVELTAGAECGNIRGQGCCDANGDVWFCASDNGADPVLFTTDCPDA